MRNYSGNFKLTYGGEALIEGTVQSRECKEIYDSEGNHIADEHTIRVIPKDETT